MPQQITLRAATRADAHFTYTMTQNPHFSRYYPKRLIPKNEKEEGDRLEKIAAHSERTGNFFSIIEVDKTPVGFIDVYKVVHEDKRCSLGYGIAHEFWKKGIATHACKKILLILKKKGFHGVEATAHPHNSASKKVLTNIGFKKIGTIKDYYFENKKFVDRELYWKILK